MINDQALQHFIDEMLANSDLNLAIVPDSIEREIYHKLLRALLTALSQTLSKTKLTLQVAGQTLELKVELNAAATTTTTANQIQ